MGERGVDFRLEEGEEKVEEVDAERVADCLYWLIALVSFFGFLVFWFFGVGNEVWEAIVRWRKRWRGVRARRTYVPSLCYDYADEEEGEKEGSADPAVGSIWCAFVKVGLVYLRS